MSGFADDLEEQDICCDSLDAGSAENSWEESVTLPWGWRRRLHEGRETLLAPRGEMFINRLQPGINLSHELVGRLMGIGSRDNKWVSWKTEITEQLTEQLIEQEGEEVFEWLSSRAVDEKSNREELVKEKMSDNLQISSTREVRKHQLHLFEAVFLNPKIVNQFEQLFSSISHFHNVLIY